MNKGKNIGFRIMFFTNIILLLGLAIVIFAFYEYKQANNGAVIKTNVNAQQQQEASIEKMIDYQTFEQNAKDFNVSTEFLQRFYNDKIVYRGKDGITFAPINPDIPKHTYNMNDIVNVNGRFEYHQNGAEIGKVGIDISKYQGNIDWKKVKADGIDFAIVRLGFRGYDSGKIVIDETFDANMKNAIAAGIDVGVYFYSQAITKEEAIEEANFVLENIKKYKITYPVVFDTEQVEAPTGRANLISTELRTDITIEFCETIKKAGYYPMLYANTRWLVAELDMTRLTQYDKWFAQYYKNVFFPYEFQMWQYTGRGKVDGVKGDVDLNVSFVDYASKISKKD